MVASTKTINEPISTSLLLGHVTLKASCFTLCTNFKGLNILLCSYNSGRSGGTRTPNPGVWSAVLYQLSYTPMKGYSNIFVTTPAPPVLPPSLIAKFNFSLIAIGVINLTVNFASSPGITISVPEGNSTSPVTSVVLK